MRCGTFSLPRFCHFTGILLLCLTSLSAQAESWRDALSVNGFFTLDATYTNRETALVGSGGDIRQYDNQHLNFKNSLIGGQLDYKLTGNLKLYVQGIATYDNQNKFDTRLDWTYLSYDLGDDAYVRAGQFQIPFLQGTELRNVGVSRIWARPLIPGSGASGFNTYKGLEYLKHIATDNAYWDIQLGAGQAEHDLSQVDNKGMQIVSVRYSRDDFWLRSAIMHANYSVYTPRKIAITNSGKVLMGSIEAEWHIAQFVLNGGYSTSRSDITPDDTMHYLSVGYQFGDFTPYLLTSLRNQYFEPFEPPTPPVPPGNNGGNRPRPPPPPDGDADNRSLAVGLRWNMTERLVLKSQFEHIQVQDAAHNPMAVRKTSSNALTVIFEGAF